MIIVEYMLYYVILYNRKRINNLMCKMYLKNGVYVYVYFVANSRRKVMINNWSFG